MGPETRQKYLTLVNEKMRAGQATLSSLEHARNTSDSRATSRYDNQREFFNEDVNTQRGLLEKLAAFETIVDQAKPTKRVEPGAELTLELWDEDEVIIGAIYSPVTVELPGLQIISSRSPMGEAMEGMVPGNTFVYRVQGKLLAGLIKDIK